MAKFFDTLGKVFSPAYATMSAGKGQKNPADAGMQNLNEIPGMAHQNLDPWINEGKTAQTTNANKYASLVNDPAAEYEKIHAGYSPTTGYNVKADKYKRAIEGAAAAGGNRSGPGEQEAQARLQQMLMEEDEGNYYDKIYNLLGLGLQGNENISARGFTGASNLTDILGNTAGAKAGLAYKGQENENQKKQDFQRFLMKLFGGAAGGIVGGPAGASIGSNIGGSFGGGGGNDNYKMFGGQLTGGQ